MELKWLERTYLKQGRKWMILDLVSLLIVTIVIGLFSLEIALLISDEERIESAAILLPFISVIPAFFGFSSILLSGYVKTEKVAKKQFINALIPLVISILAVIMIFGFSEIDILQDSKNAIISNFGNHIAFLSAWGTQLGSLIFIISMIFGVWLFIRGLFYHIWKKQDN